MNDSHAWSKLMRKVVPGRERQYVKNENEDNIESELHQKLECPTHTEVVV